MVRVRERGWGCGDGDKELSRIGQTFSGHPSDVGQTDSGVVRQIIGDVISVPRTPGCTYVGKSQARELICICITVKGKRTNCCCRILQNKNIVRSITGVRSFEEIKIYAAEKGKRVTQIIRRNGENSIVEVITAEARVE